MSSFHCETSLSDVQKFRTKRAESSETLFLETICFERTYLTAVCAAKILIYGLS